jgi:hypothetical protein
LAYDPRSIFVKPNKISPAALAAESAPVLPDRLDRADETSTLLGDDRGGAQRIASTSDAVMNAARQWSIPGAQKRARHVGRDPAHHTTTTRLLLWHQQGGTNPRANLDSRPSLGCGWSLVLPRECVPIFWKAFAVAGALAVGQNEMRALALEQGHAYFPRDFLDTACGRFHQELEARRRTRQHCKRAREHRSNHVKLRVPWPLTLAAAEGLPYHRLQGGAAERGTSTQGQRPTRGVPGGNKHRRGRWVLENPSPQHHRSSDSTTAAAGCSMHAVHVRMVGRGHPRAGAGIYLASARDADLYAREGRHAKCVALQLEKKGTAQDCEPSRECVGRLTSAGIAQGMAVGVGVGNLHAKAFRDAEKCSSSILVMVRNASSRWYMFALATKI